MKSIFSLKNFVALTDVKAIKFSTAYNECLVPSKLFPICQLFFSAMWEKANEMGYINPILC